MDTLAFFNTWFDRFWINEDMTAADDMVPADVTVHGLTDAPQITRDGLREFGQALLALCKFDDISIKRFAQEDDWAHMLVVFKGTARATGKQIDFDAQVLARVQDEQIVECYNHPDFFNLFQQLGSLPADAIARCLRCDPLQ